MKKRFFTALLSLVLITGFLPMTVLADEVPDGTSSDYRLDIEGMLGEKTAEGNAQTPGEYEVTVQVPGASQSEQYAEIIIMADASDSINNAANWDNFQRMVKALGQSLLSANTSLKLTLMGFGIGPKLAGTFSTLEELTVFIDSATSADFQQERSATNCEVGFTFVEEYLKKSANINKTYVIYISDAAANLDETPLDWSKWQDPAVFDYFKSFSLAQVKSYIVSTEASHIADGYAPLTVTSAVFQEACNEVQRVKAELADEFAPENTDYHNAVEALYNEMTQNSDAYIHALLEDIHTHSGLTYGQSYSSSTIELAFQKYYTDHIGTDDSSYDSFMDAYYLIQGDTGYTKLTNRYQRAAEASLRLQQLEKVLGIYHVCYSTNSNNWMNPAYVQANYGFAYTDKASYLYGANFGEAITALEDAIEDVTATIYKDVTVTDPMSKWVFLEPETISIYAGSTKIYQYGQGDNAGWLIDNPPVVDENGNPKAPIILTVNDKGLYEITWYVKTGNLLLSDHYSLKYTVKLNQEAEGYVPGTNYPLNDPTSVRYTDEKGEEQEKDIAVPQGVVYVVAYKYTSGTPGMDLPENFVPVPVDTGSYTDKTGVDAQAPDVLSFDDAENDGVWTFRAWDEDTKKIDGENITFAGEWVFTANTYTVDYSYTSGTPGMDLPENFVPVPVDTGSYTDKTGVDAQAPEVLSFDDAENNGVWTFRAWDANTKQINRASIAFAGEWVFTANPEAPVPSNPNTGDGSNMLLWIILMAFSAAGLTGTVLFGRKIRFF